VVVLARVRLIVAPALAVPSVSVSDFDVFPACHRGNKPLSSVFLLDFPAQLWTTEKVHPILAKLFCSAVLLLPPTRKPLIRYLVNNPELYNDWRWVWTGTFSSFSLLLLGLGLLVVVGLTWRTTLRLTSLRQRFALLSLRLVGAALLWLLLAGPSLELRNVQKIRNHVPVFVDTSASMGVSRQPGQPTRIQKVQSFLNRNKRFWETLKKEQRVRFFRFDRKVLPTSSDGKALQAKGDKTDLLQLPLYLQQYYRGKPLGGVVLMTDGIDTVTEPTDSGGTSKKDKVKQRKLDSNRRQRELLRQLKRLQVPVHVIAPRPDKALKDLAVVDVFGDAFAFLHNTASIETLVRVKGFTRGSIRVSLYKEGRRLRSKYIRLQADKTDYRVVFKFKPRKAGKFIYSVRVPQMDGESVAENNRKDFILKIIRDRIRVLQVTGRPSWDVRFLRRLLKKNASIDLISFFILRTHQSTNTVPQRDMALIPFPSHELFTTALKSFDLVIFQNFNFGPYRIRRYLPNIRRFVRQGGAFVMVGGNLSFGSGGYLNTPIETILPIKLDLGNVNEDSFKPVLTRSGRHHPITRLLPGNAQNTALWKKLPALPGLNLLGDLKFNGVSLLEHPKLKTDNGKPRSVLSVGFYGKGRVMALAADGSWYWNLVHIGQGGSRTPYYRFWNNAIRWLIRDPELERVRITAAKSSFRLGEKARFRVQVLDRRYRPLRKGKVRIQAIRSPGNRVLRTSTHSLQSSGSLLYEWKPPGPGVYRLKVRYLKKSRRPIVGTDLFKVTGLNDEFQQVRPNLALFNKIRKATGGRLLYLDQELSSLSLKPPTVLRVDRSQTLDVWDNFAFLFLLVGLFSAEWWFRRRWGLP
jgi:uncharacterized membrane protein